MTSILRWEFRSRGRDSRLRIERSQEVLWRRRFQRRPNVGSPTGPQAWPAARPRSALVMETDPNLSEATRSTVLTVSKPTGTIHARRMSETGRLTVREPISGRGMRDAQRRYAEGARQSRAGREFHADGSERESTGC